MSEEIVSSSQTETAPEVKEVNEDVTNAFAMFGITPQKEEMPAPESEEDQEAPAKEITDSKKLTVKYNKEDIEIDEDKIPELVQKGLGLDKERERKGELEKTLDRAAKLAGFDNHADYIANLDKLEQQQQQKQQSQLDELREDMLSQLEANGVDRVRAEEWINSHPLIKQGEEAVAERQKATQQSKANEMWQPLYKAYPELGKAVAEANGQSVDWYTPEFAQMVERGNEPLLVYEHLNRDKVRAETTKAAEQKAIKDVMLGKRSQVETTPTTDTEPHVPEALTSAFSMFGLNPKSAKKYVK